MMDGGDDGGAARGGGGERGREPRRERTTVGMEPEYYVDELRRCQVFFLDALIIGRAIAYHLPWIKILVYQLSN
jgi:hypothetical protein